MRRGEAFARFLDGIERGDPVALGLLGVVGLFGAFVAATWIIDLKSKKKEREKEARRRGRDW